MQNIQVKAQENQDYINDLEKKEIGMDLKYRNRNELINIIKSLLLKLKKHQKNCPSEDL